MGGDDDKEKEKNMFSAYTMMSNDNPGSIITHVLLKGENYEEWSRGMQISLLAKNKLGFINGKETEPSADSEKNERWWIINAMVVAWIFNTIEGELRKTISYRNTAKELWDDIKQRFSVGNGTKIYQLKAEIIECKQRKDESVMSYFGRIKKIWDDLNDYDALPACTCNGCKCRIMNKLEARRENERVREFLMGLDSSYAAVRSNILGTEPLLNINQVYSKLIQEEGVKTYTAAKVETKPEPMAFKTQAIAYAKGSGGAYKETHDKVGEKPVCWECGLEGVGPRPY